MADIAKSGEKPQKVEKLGQSIQHGSRPHRRHLNHHRPTRQMPGMPDGQSGMVVPSVNPLHASCGTRAQGCQPLP